MSSLNQSLKRMNLEYVDIFYTHRYDPNTPLEETLQHSLTSYGKVKRYTSVFPNTLKTKQN